MNFDSDSKILLIVAICLGIGLYYFAKPSLGIMPLSGDNHAPQVLYISGDTLGQKAIDVKIGAWYFSVPVNRLDTILEESKVATGELRSGFSFVGNWPDFEPRTISNIQEFLGTTNKRITVDVSRICALISKNTCDPGARMNSSFDILTESYPEGIGGQDFFLASKLPLFSAPMIAGYEHYGFVDRRRGDKAILASDHDINVYKRIDEEGNIDFARCLRKTHGYSCKHEFIWRNSLRISVFYAVQYAKDWLSIKSSVLNTLESMAVSDSDYHAPTFPHCIRVPFPLRRKFKDKSEILNDC